MHFEYANQLLGAQPQCEGNAARLSMQHNQPEDTPIATLCKAPLHSIHDLNSFRRVNMC